MYLLQKPTVPDGAYVTHTQIHYTPKDVLHRRLIQTIYRRLVKEKRACPDVGSHWDTIGFQGTDPCTDLNRSMGVLSLLQVRRQNKHAQPFC